MVLVAALILGVACGLVAVAVSASLRVVIGKPLGIRASAGSYSRQAELTGSATVKGGFARRRAELAGRMWDLTKMALLNTFSSLKERAGVTTMETGRCPAVYLASMSIATT